MVPNFPQSSYIESRIHHLNASQDSFMHSAHNVAAALAALGCLVFSACAQPSTLTILHTNDMHATFVPREATWVKESPKPMVGGFKQLEYTINSYRKDPGKVLLLDAGDVMTGNPVTERVYQGAQGGALFEMMNLMGYDAWCVGNHDMDISQENLAALVKVAKFPTTSANLVKGKDLFPQGNQPYVILERGGVRIGIIGVMSQELYGLVIQTNLTGIRVLSPVETVQRYIDELDPKTDLLIALTHQGVTDDSILAANVQGLDLIVGGHSHTRLKSPMVVNGVYILQAGSNTENLGVADLVVENDRITRLDGKLVTLWADKKTPPTRLGELVDSLQTEIDHEYDEVIGVLKGDWVRREGANTIGSYVTEAQRQAVRADIGLMNIHGIRRDIPAGPLTKRELFEALPFRNVLATFQLSGAQLRAAFAYALQERPAIIATGITGEWKLRPDGTVVLQNIRVGGNPLDDKRFYSCTANDYLVGEAKRYLGLELNNVIYLKRTLFNTVEDAVRRDKEIVPEVILSFTPSR